MQASASFAGLFLDPGKKIRYSPVVYSRESVEIRWD